MTFTAAADRRHHRAGKRALDRPAERAGFAERETAVYKDEPILLFRRRLG